MVHSHIKPGAGRRRLAIAAAALAIASLGVSTDDVVYVNRVSLTIRSGKFAFDKALATAVQGDALTVEEVNGRWLKVRYTPRFSDPNHPSPPVEGFVLQDALSARQVAAATTRQTGSAEETGSAGAGRGLLNAGRYATAKGLSPDAFYKMVTESREAMKDADNDFQQFDETAQIGLWSPVHR